VIRCRWLVVALAAATAFTVAPPAAAAGEPPWKAAETLRRQLFDAQAQLILGSPDSAAAAVRRARREYGGEAAGVRAALRDAERAAARGDEVAVAAARGAARAAVFREAFTAALEATARGDVQEAQAWLLVREFRTATRFTRPGADATQALTRLAAGTLPAAEARQAVGKDLLDAYQARLRELLDDVAAGQERDLPVRRAEAAAQAEGYFAILAARYAEDRGAPAAARARAAFATLSEAAVAGRDVTVARERAAATLNGFTAAPLTGAEAARRAQQLLRFLALVPVEYERGVSDGRVTKDFEIQEAVAFQGGARAALADLQDQIAKRDAERTAAGAADLERLGAVVNQATRTPDAVAGADEVEALAARVEASLTAPMPKAWTEPSEESDYDLIALTLDRMEAAVGAGEHRQAEQARLEAYAFFEFGPERRLQAFDSALALEVEGLIWFGASGQPGLARLIAAKAPRREVRENRLALDAKLADSAATLGDSASRATVVTNAAIIVFREGLEAVLILAAITASFVGARRGLRRPVLVGAGLGLLASAVTWALAQTLLRSLDQYGEKLRGRRRPDRGRGAPAHHQLVLPPRLLERVDRQVPPAAPRAREDRPRRPARLPECSGRRARDPRPHQRLPRGVRNRALPPFAAALGRDGGRARGRRARPGHDARCRGRHVRAPAQASLQADARLHRRDDRLRARRHGRADRAHHAGYGLAADHEPRLRAAVLARPLVRGLSHVGDDRRPARLGPVRDRLVLPRQGAEGQAAATPCAGGPPGRPDL
jgi:high-affinity iron transporter